MPYLDIKIIQYSSINTPTAANCQNKYTIFKTKKLMTFYWPTVPMVLTYFQCNKHYHDISGSVGL